MVQDRRYNIEEQCYFRSGQVEGQIIIKGTGFRGGWRKFTCIMVRKAKYSRGP